MWTPEWANILFTQLEAKLIDMESNLAESSEFATKIAIDAAIKVGVLNADIKKYSNEMELATVNSDHKALQAKVINLEDHSRRHNLLFFGFTEAQNETRSKTVRVRFMIYSGLCYLYNPMCLML